MRAVVCNDSSSDDSSEEQWSWPKRKNRYSTLPNEEAPREKKINIKTATCVVSNIPLKVKGNASCSTSGSNERKSRPITPRSYCCESTFTTCDAVPDGLDVDENGYEPHKHRNVKYPLSNDEALMSIIKCGIGTGCLAMPMAFSKSGWALGIASSMILGLISLHCLHILINGSYKLSQIYCVPQLSYSKAMCSAILQGPEIFHVFSGATKTLVDFTMVVYHFGVCCVYSMFIAENVKNVADYYVGISLDSRLYICLLTGPLIWLICLRDLKNLMPYTAFSNILFCIGFVFTIGFMCIKLPSISERETISSLHGFPIFFGTMLFALESVGVVIAIEQNMACPEYFLGATGILNRGMAVVLLIYAGFGFLGYWKYGAEVSDSVTLNLPVENILSQMVKIAFAISIYLSYALQGYVAVDVIRNHCISDLEGKRYVVMDYVIRLILVFTTIFCAVNVPHFGSLITLTGALCLSLLCLIFPAILDLCITKSDHMGIFILKFCKNILIIALGLCGGYFGSRAAISEIKSNYKYVF